MNTTPVSLLERLRESVDQDAWTRFVDLYTPLIYSWGRKVGLQADDAMDLVQEVFTILVQEMPKFVYDPNHRFRAWLKTVTLNRWREKRRRAGVRPDAGTISLTDDIASPDGSDAFWEDEYRQHLVHRAIKLMESDFSPAAIQACLQVAYGRRVAEVAQELGLTAGAVCAAKCRILNRVRQELAGLLD